MGVIKQWQLEHQYDKQCSFEFDVEDCTFEDSWPLRALVGASRTRSGLGVVVDSATAKALSFSASGIRTPPYGECGMRQSPLLDVRGVFTPSALQCVRFPRGFDCA
jgi:hypothetical protein